MLNEIQQENDKSTAVGKFDILFNEFDCNDKYHSQCSDYIQNHKYLEIYDLQTVN